MSLQPKEGVVVAGRFRLERRLGRGGMGDVWAATNTVTLRRVAVKFLHGDDAHDPIVWRRFFREARAASAVSHPNVVEVLDVLELDDGSPAMVMELLEGEPLRLRLRREGKIPLPELASLMLPAVAAIGAAHAAGVVHRDVKPDNIFISRGHDDAVVVKVLDFGIAKMANDGDGAANGLTGTGEMLGTPYYMAPEQLFTDDTIDYRCDVWALGVILYECLAGTRPAKGDNFADIVKVIATRAIPPLERVAPELPTELTSLVSRMLSFDKEARPGSLHEACDVLQRYTDVRVPSFGEPVLKPVRLQGAEPDLSNSGLRGGDAEASFAGGGSANDEALAATVDHPLTPSDTHSRLGLGLTLGKGAPSAGAPASAGKRGAKRAALLGAAVLTALGAAGLAVVRARPSEASAAAGASSARATGPARTSLGSAPLAAEAVTAGAGVVRAADGAAAATPAKPADAAPSDAPSTPASSTAAPSPAASSARAVTRVTGKGAAPARAASAAATPASAAPAAPPAPTSGTGGLVEKPPF